MSNTSPSPNSQQGPAIRYLFPMRGDRGAPCFDETPRGLKRFFREVERMFDAQGVPHTGQMLIDWAITWVSADVQDLFESFRTTSMTWEQFQTKAMTYYPGADGFCRYSIADIEHLSLEWSRKGVHSHADYGDYLRQFQVLASDLLSNRKVDEGLLERLFMQGFGLETRRKLESRLQIILPNHFYDDPYPRKDIEQAALFILSATPADRECQEMARAHSLSTPVVQSEADSLASTLLLIQTQIAQLSLAVQARTASQTSNPVRNRLCVFCSSPGHLIHGCDTLEEYIRAGKCIRDANRKVVLPDGQFLPQTIAGNNLKIRFDTWWSTYTPNPPSTTSPTPTASANMLSAAVYHHDDALMMWSNEDDESDGRKTNPVKISHVQAPAPSLQAVIIDSPSSTGTLGSYLDAQSQSGLQTPADDPQLPYTSYDEDPVISEQVFDMLFSTIADVSEVWPSTAVKPESQAANPVPQTPPAIPSIPTKEDSISPQQNPDSSLTEVPETFNSSILAPLLSIYSPVTSDSLKTSPISLPLALILYSPSVSITKPGGSDRKPSLNFSSQDINFPVTLQPFTSFDPFTASSLIAKTSSPFEFHPFSVFLSQFPFPFTLDRNRTWACPKTASSSILRTWACPKTASLSISRTWACPKTASLTLSRTWACPKTAPLSFSGTLACPKTVPHPILTLACPEIAHPLVLRTSACPKTACLQFQTSACPETACLRVLTMTRPKTVTQATTRTSACPKTACLPAVTPRIITDSMYPGPGMLLEEFPIVKPIPHAETIIFSSVLPPFDPRIPSGLSYQHFGLLALYHLPASILDDTLWRQQPDSRHSQDRRLAIAQKQGLSI